MDGRPMIFYTYRKDGSGTLWVHRPRGTWRRITFRRLVDVIDRLSAATTTPLPDRLLVAQSAPGAVAATPKAPRAGPVTAAIQPCGP